MTIITAKTTTLVWDAKMARVLYYRLMTELQSFNLAPVEFIEALKMQRLKVAECDQELFLHGLWGDMCNATYSKEILDKMNKNATNFINDLYQKYITK